MEVIIGLIVIALVLYLLYLLVVHVLWPIARILGVIAAVVCLGYAFYTSIRNFIAAIIHNRDAYTTYTDSHRDAPPGVRRNYFFGPGIHQMKEILSSAFANQQTSCAQLAQWRDKALTGSWVVNIPIYLVYGFAFLCTQLLGFVWMSVFSVVLVSVIALGFLAFFLLFSIIWLVDRGVLLVRSIHSRCPYCKRKSVIPVFVCPSCGLEHRQLVPGPYGVLKRKCGCGKALSTTFLGGRSRYKAECRYCSSELLSSDSRQYGIQLIGGIGTGKTTFLTAFWHEYKEFIDTLGGVSIQAKPEEAFTELENWYQTGMSEHTLDANASMYSIIHTYDRAVPVQMTIYDIAGEAFSYGDSGVYQEQFRYCEGYLLVIDPTAAVETNADTIANFINTYVEMAGKSVSKGTDTPLAILITKCDRFRREIGLPKIKATYVPTEGAEDPAADFERHRDEMCWNFLYDRGYGNALNLVESAFTRVRFFPVSAMGHEPENGEYEPWGILAPVLWLMRQDTCPLRELLNDVPGQTKK